MFGTGAGVFGMEIGLTPDGRPTTLGLVGRDRRKGMDKVTVSLTRGTLQRMMELASEDVIRCGIDRTSRYADRRAAAETAYAAAKTRETELYDAVCAALGLDPTTGEERH